MISISKTIGDIKFSICILCLMSFSAAADHHGEADEKAHSKTVLVTGASSGIGLRITEVLSDNGYIVYAGARKEADLKRLDAMENVESVRLDVTVQAEIDAAVKFVEAKGRGLDALVNNAGIVVVGPLIEVPVEELEWQMNVNVLGPFRVTKAFAPLIIASKGRITTTGSISGILSGSMFGHYSMSKHAIEAYTDSLATEMARFDVQVSVIEPGNYQSEIGKSFAKRLEKKNFWAEDTLYADELERMKARMGSDDKQKDPLEVAEAVMHALSSQTPKRRYLVTPNAAQAEYTVSRAMTEMLELNHSQPYSLSKERLVEILTEQLEALE